MTAPQPRAGGLDANARGIMVLAVAVLVGLLLLWKAGSTGDASELSTGGDTSTTIDTSGLGSDDTTAPIEGEGDGEAGGTTSTTVVDGEEARSPSDITVLVLNGGSAPSGTAAFGSEVLKAAGYQTGTPGNATTDVASTTIYYAEGYQVEAAAVASLVGLATDAVQAMPTPLPGPGADAANIVLVLGPETAPVGEAISGGATTTTEAG